MTVTLGWKHAVIASLVVVAIALGFTWAVRNAQQRDILDAERIALIDALEEEVEAVEAEAEKAHQEANEIRDELRIISEPLVRTRKALKYAETRPLAKSEEIVILREQNDLLEQALKLSNDESLALRRALTLTGMALDNTKERYDLLNKRYSSLRRTQKKTKRRNIWTSVTVASAGLMVGFGIGRL
jgi:nitrogen fixation-related uncharacterized protein